MKRSRILRSSLVHLAIALGASVPVDAAERLLVTDIAFERIERLTRAQLLVTVGLAIGSTYTERELRDQIERDIERLYRTGEFESAGPLDSVRIEDHAGGKRVVFPVSEKKRIGGVSLSGGKPVGSSFLLEDLKTAAGRLYSAASLREDRDTLIKRCHSKGFLFAEVDHAVTSRPGGMVNVQFTVAPGPCARIYEIRFVGSTVATDGELKDQMATQERDFWFLGLLRKGYFSPERLSQDMKQLRAYLRGTKGLLDANVGVEEIRFDESRERIYITIRVDEGKTYTLRDFDVRTQTPQGKEPRFEAGEVLREAGAARYVGDRFRATEIDALANRILKLYMDVGYYHCKVKQEEPRVDASGTEATAVLSIDEKEPVYARRIDIKGNAKTKDEVIRRELAFAPGDLVTFDKIMKSRSNLYRLQYFEPERLDITPLEATSSPEGTDFLVEVEEGSRGQLLFGVGIAQDLGVIGSFVLRKTNFDIADLPDSFWDIPDSFTGAGQTLSIEVQPGTQYSRYRASFSEPYVFGHWYGLTVYGARQISGRDTWLEREWGLGFRVHRYFTQDRDISVSAGYRYNVTELDDIEPGAPADAFEWAGTTRISAVSAGFNFDRHLFDPYSGPYKGYRLWIEYEYAGGFLDADVGFSRARTGVAGFIPIIENSELGHHVLTVTGNFGWMEAHSGTPEVPIFERFWLGGPYSFRGFRPYGVGPHENGEEIGGTALVYGTVEYSWPLLLAVPEVKFLRGLAFFDWGQLEGPHMVNGKQEWDFDQLAMDRMRYAAGVGLRINLTPLGMPVPISLYWGEAIRSMPEDRERSFLFTIGQIGF